MPALAALTALRGRTRLLRLGRSVAMGACALAIAFVAVRYYHVPHHALRWLQGWQPSNVAWPAPALAGTALSGLSFDIHGQEVSGVERNLSGIAYRPDADTLLAVTNRPPQIFVLDRAGRVLRRHRIEGASDVEDLAYLGNGRVALLQEGRRAIAVAQLPARDGAPLHVDREAAHVIDMPESDNDGPEGLAYDAATDTLYVAKERRPAALYALQGLGHGSAPRQRDLSAWLAPLPFLTDLSGLAFDARAQRLVLLSDEAQMLVALDAATGRPMEWRALSAGQPGALPPPQPEGIALDGRGTWFVVSEPDLFYRLRTTDAPPAPGISG